MTKKIFALLLLSLTMAACDSSSTETNSNANKPASAIDHVSPTPAPSPSLEPSPSVQSQLKVGDKVRVAANGSFVDATVVSVDEKLGKVTVKLRGESKERTFAIGDTGRQ